MCLCDFSVGNNHQADCKKHIYSNKHKTWSNETSKQVLFNSLCQKMMKQGLTYAKSLFAPYLLEHSISLINSNYVGNLFNMLSDTKIA